MKILIFGSFVNGALEHQYVRGLNKLGWNVYCFETRLPLTRQTQHMTDKIIFRLFPEFYLRNLNIEIVKTAREIKPEIILVFKGMEIFPETLLELKNYTRLLCNYNPDHPFEFYSRGSGNRFVLESIKHYDIYFSYSQSVCEQLRKKFNALAECVPFGFDETLKGTIFKRESVEDKFVFVGAWDRQRVQYFKELTQFPIRIYGPAWNKAKKLNQFFYAGYSIFSNDYCDVTFSAKGVLNFLRSQNIKEQSHNMRTFEVPGYGGLMISNRTNEQCNFFEEDEEAVYFDSMDELKDKLRFYSKNNTANARIKDNAFKRTRKSGYSYCERSCTLSSILKSYV